MTERCFIGADVGTTGTKSMLISESGEVLGHAYAPYPLSAPGVSRSEQDALDWWRGLVSTIREVVTKAGAQDRVAAISLSLQGGTMVPVDEKLNPLRPAIVWNDRRAAKQAADFASRFGKSYIYEKSGWHLSGSLNAMEIAWLRENEPDTYKKAAMFLSVPDFVSAKLTGRAALDISDAGINELTDIRSGKYDPAILDFCGISEAQLGDILPSGAPIGYLTDAAKEELGLTGDVLLAAGAHDQYAGLLGAGVTEAGDVLIGTGTAWVVTALTDAPNFESDLSQSISAVPGKWGSMECLSTGGVSLDWFLGNVARSGEDCEKLSYKYVDEHAAARAPGAGGLMFFPYFGGSSYPAGLSGAKATFLGMDLSHDRFDMARAVMEGVAFQIVLTVGAFDRRFGFSRLRMSGGATKSALWRQMVADIAGRPVTMPATPDLPCVGAAILAGVGCGAYSSPAEGYRAMRIPSRVVEPSENREKYGELLKLYEKRASALGAVYGK